MIFTDFLKVREGKNKYGMLGQNFNRRASVAMEHNGGGMVSWGLEPTNLSTK